MRCVRKVAIDGIEGDRVTERGSVLNQAFGSVRGHCLPFFVVPDIALCAAHASRHHSLSHAKTLSNGFDVVHSAILAALGFNVNSAGSCNHA